MPLIRYSLESKKITKAILLFLSKTQNMDWRLFSPVHIFILSTGPTIDTTRNSGISVVVFQAYTSSFLKNHTERHLTCFRIRCLFIYFLQFLYKRQSTRSLTYLCPRALSKPHFASFSMFRRTLQLICSCYRCTYSPAVPPF